MARSDPIKTIAVIGTGIIGASYTALFLANGLRVITSPTKPDGKQRLKDAVAKAWPTLENIGLKEGASQDNLEFVDDVMEHLDRVDLVQENGPERLDYKTTLFANVDSRTPSHVPIVSSTSGFPSSKFIGECKNHPGRILIAHPFNPPHLIPVVEVVPHPGTDNSIVERTVDFFKSIGQQPIRINVETPGFVLNRLQAALNWEAFSLVHRGVIAPGDLDAAMTSGLGLRWALSGPFLNLSLASGSGAAGFKRTLEHIAPAAQGWMKDMDDHRFVYTQDNEDDIAEKAAKMFDEMGADQAVQMAKVRNEALVELVKLKKEKGEGLLK